MSEHGQNLDPALKALADAYGIATDYWDWQGRHVVVAPATVRAVLAAQDVDASTPESTFDGARPPASRNRGRGCSRRAWRCARAARPT